MSYSIFVFLNKKDLPSLDQLQEAITKEGFNLRFHVDFSFKEQSGGVPFLINNDEDEEYDFGYYSCSSEEERVDECTKNIFEDPQEWEKILNHYDYMASFVFSSSTEAMIGSCITSAVLAKLTNGIVMCEDGPLQTADEAIQEAKRIIIETEAERKSKVQKSGINRTPELWRAKCLETLKKINADYEENPEYKKSSRYFEFTKLDPSGLIVSQNYEKDDDISYNHSVCYIFSKHKESIFKFGSRFDKSMWQLLDEDFKNEANYSYYRKIIHSHYKWYPNTFQLMERTIRISEEYILPYYRSKVVEKAQILLNLFMFVQSILDSIHLVKIEDIKDIEENVMLQEYLEFKELKLPNHKIWEKYDKQRFILLNALHKAEKLPKDYKYKETFVEAMDISFDISFLDVLITYANAFLVTKDELPNMIQICRNLTEMQITKFEHQNVETNIVRSPSFSKVSSTQSLEKTFLNKVFDRILKRS